MPKLNNQYLELIIIKGNFLKYNVEITPYFLPFGYNNDYILNARRCQNMKIKTKTQRLAAPRPALSVYYIRCSFYYLYIYIYFFSSI